MKKGFTLIELLIATAIFGVVSGGGLASYNQFNQREKLKAASLGVKTHLRRAQTNALAGVKNEAECAGRPLDGWCIDLQHGYLYGHCGGPAGAAPAPVDFDIEDTSLIEGISIEFSPSYGGVFLFKPIGQGVNLGQVEGDDLAICLSSSAFGKTYRYKLSVSTAGEISDEGFVGNCP